MYKLFHKREKVVTVRLGIYSLPEVAVPFKNACLYPRPESIFKRAQFQSLISMESWEINPFLDALILTTNIVLVFSTFKHQLFTSLSSTFGSTYISDIFWDQKSLRKKIAQEINNYFVFSMCTCELSAISHVSMTWV